MIQGIMGGFGELLCKVEFGVEADAEHCWTWTTRDNGHGTRIGVDNEENPGTVENDNRMSIRRCKPTHCSRSCCFTSTCAAETASKLSVGPDVPLPCSFALSSVLSISSPEKLKPKAMIAMVSSGQKCLFEEIVQCMEAEVRH